MNESSSVPRAPPFALARRQASGIQANRSRRLAPIENQTVRCCHPSCPPTISRNMLKSLYITWTVPHFSRPHASRSESVVAPAPPASDRFALPATTRVAAAPLTPAVRTACGASPLRSPAHRQSPCTAVLPSTPARSWQDLPRQYGAIVLVNTVQPYSHSVYGQGTPALAFARSV